MSTKRDNTDAGLFLKIREGDRLAFDIMYSRYRGLVFAFCKGILKQEDVSEDITQDVFVSLWNHRDVLECSSGSMKPLLYRMTRNKVFDYLKSRYVKSSVPMDISHSEVQSCDTPEMSLQFKELSRAMKRSIENLPEKRREAFILSHFDNLSYREISEIMDISETTVKKHVELALRDLRMNSSMKSLS